MFLGAALGLVVGLALGVWIGHGFARWQEAMR